VTRLRRKSSAPTAVASPAGVRVGVCRFRCRLGVPQAVHQREVRKLVTVGPPQLVALHAQFTLSVTHGAPFVWLSPTSCGSVHHQSDMAGVTG